MTTWALIKLKRRISSFMKLAKMEKAGYKAGKTAGSWVISDAAGGSVKWAIFLGDNMVTWV